jgi:septal ring factor EnvC (AmiA/AmiB activator)
MWLLLIIAVAPMISTSRATAQDDPELYRALGRLEGKTAALKQAVKDIRNEKDELRKEVAACRELQDKTEGQMSALVAGNVQLSKDIGIACDRTEKLAISSEELCAMAKEVSAELRQVLCLQKQTACTLEKAICIACKLDKNIRNAKRRAFTVGLLIGLGIRFGAGGGMGGIPLPIPSPGIW